MQRDLTPEEIEKKNNRKLTADKIRQILSKVLETPTQSSKRWVWELVQNAKDIPNKFGKVSVKIEMSEDSLRFSHNGNPFSLSNIMGLIQQVSSKDSTNTDEEVTGKFGTGFISTHLLSRKIMVKGLVLHNGKHRLFETLLDRDGDSSEKLIPKIEEALERIGKIEEDQLFPVFHNYEGSRTEQSFDTVFEYELTSENSKKWAKDGLEDLVNTLPQTLVNLEKIKTVTVINKGVKEIYEKKEKFKRDGVTAYEIYITNKSTKKFLSYTKDEITLAVELEKFEPITLTEHFGEQPNLFRDFPLIGSEKFHFPYILNGHKFNPTEDRDSIVLHSDESKEAISNRAAIEKAAEVSQEFTQWLINNNAVNRYICANTRRPELAKKWEDFSKKWYTELQGKWRKQLIELPLLETEGGTITELKNAIIPEDGSTNELKLEFYDLAKPIFSKNFIPQKGQLFDWLKVLGPKSDKEQRETWGITLSRGIENLLETISGFGDKKSLLEKTELETPEDVDKWLNSLYQYLAKTLQTEFLSKYELIPNQYGDLRKLTDLFLEDPEKPIPDELLNILDKFGVFWRKDLIDRNIKIDQNIDTKGCSEISEAINKILKEEKGEGNNKEFTFLQRTDAKEILIDILKLESINYNENFQSKLFNKGKDLFKFEDEIKPIENIAPFNFINAKKRFVTLINQTLDTVGELGKLQEKLALSEEDTLYWLNDYLSLIQENNYLLEEEYKIIPNRYKDFISFDMAKSFGTKETPLDDKLVDILYKLNNKEDWKTFLAHDGIEITFKELRKFEELSQAIRSNIARIQTEDYQNPDEEILENYRGPILDLIEWVMVSENKKLVNSYFENFEGEAKNLSFKLIVGNSDVGISAIKLLQDEKSVNLLLKIQESSVSTEDLEELIDLVNEIGSASSLKKRAQELYEEKKNREFLYKVGEKVEEAIKSALTEFDVRKVSVGSFDLKVSKNDKSYYLEVKSYKHNSNFPLLFAPSQAEKAMLNEPNYAVCTIERPIADDNNIPIEYIKNKLKYAKQLSSEFEKGVGDLGKFREIRQNKSSSKLKVDVLGEIRVQIDKNSIVNKSGSFDNLINDIRRELS